MSGAVGALLVLGSLVGLVIGLVGVVFRRVPFTPWRSRRAGLGVMLGSVVAFGAGGTMLPTRTAPPATNPAPKAAKARPSGAANAGGSAKTSARAKPPAPARHLLRVTVSSPRAITQVLDPNGSEVARWQGSSARFKLPAGTYFVRSSGPQLVAAKAKVALTAPRSLAFTLKRDRISVAITANTGAASYRVFDSGGRLVASARGASARFSLPRARYKIAVRAPGFEPLSLWSQGGTLRAELARIPLPPPPAPLEPRASGGRGYVNSAGEFVPSPTFTDERPSGASARCRDGSYSFSRSRRGTCSHHGGVAEWY